MCALLHRQLRRFPVGFFLWPGRAELSSTLPLTQQRHLANGTVYFALHLPLALALALFVPRKLSLRFVGARPVWQAVT